MEYFYVGMGGLLGAITRHALGQALATRNRCDFPRGTFIINLTGAFLFGLLVSEPAIGQRLGPHLFLALTTGFLGAYTTFSTFSCEVIRLLDDGQLFKALTYTASSISLGLLLAWFGHVFILLSL